ncbi:MAG: LPS-assembly protein LptD [Chlorobiaceae bacterium]|nr:LPS-assembly protein LptD [Chlorobiaceae bacterium]
MKFIHPETSILTLVCLIALAGPFSCIGSLCAAEQSERKLNSTAERKISTGSKLGASGLNEIVQFSAKDSLIYNLDGKSMELWGKARLNHEATTVKASKIVVDLESSQLHAIGSADSSKTASGLAEFTDRQGSFSAGDMTYNFKTGRGETSRISSSSNGVIVNGEKVERRENGELCIKDGTFTTCDDIDPHYWFSASSMTIVPDSRISAKNLVMHVKPEIFSKRLPPLPLLALPYMVFPLREGRVSGFLIPHIAKDDRGYLFSKFGYFWAINDYMDLRPEADIALNGSWRLGERFRYAKRDMFSGEISGEYNDYFKDSDAQSYRNWNATVRHNQVLNSSTRFDINMRLLGGNRYYDLNTMDSETIVEEQANARVSLARTFNNENGIAALYYDRIDNLLDKTSDQRIGVSYYQNRVYPFRSTASEESGDWKSDVSITSGASYVGDLALQSDQFFYGYTANAGVELGLYRQFGEGNKALFTQGMTVQKVNPNPLLDNSIYNGTTVTLPFRIQSTVFHHFNLNSGLSFTSFHHAYDGTKDFSAPNFNVDASTRLYGTMTAGFLENLFGLKALRHTFIPMVSYRWNPSFSGNAYNYYHNLYDWTDNRFFNRFDSALYPGLPEGQSSVGITLKNLFHGKFRGTGSASDGSADGDHTVQLLSMSASTAYNFAAETCRFDPLTVIASSNAMSSNLLFSSGAMYDFYSYDPVTGERINRTNREDGRGLLRFVKGFFNMSYSVQGKRDDKSAIPPPTDSMAPVLPNTSQALFRERFNFGNFNTIDYSLPWELRFSLFMQNDHSNPVQPAVTSSLINASARISFLKEWQVGLYTGYDFQNEELVFPMVQIYRNLHCWQIGVQVVPVGEFKSYAIQIGLKAPQLSDVHFRTSGSTKGWF